MQKSGHRVLKGVNWVLNDKIGKMVLKGVSWINNTKIRVYVMYGKSHSRIAFIKSSTDPEEKSEIPHF